MPGSFQKTDELHQGAVPKNQGMGRDAHIGNGWKIRVFRRVQAVGEKLLNIVTTKLAGGKADIVHHKKTYERALRPGPIVG